MAQPLPSLGEVQALRRELDTHHRRLLAHVRWMQDTMGERLQQLRILYIASAKAVEGSSAAATTTKTAVSHPTGSTDAALGVNRPPTPVAHPVTLSEVPLESLFKRLPGSTSAMQRWCFDDVLRASPLAAAYVAVADEASRASASLFPLAASPEALTMASFLASLGQGFTLSAAGRVAGSVDGRPMTQPPAEGALVAAAAAAAPAPPHPVHGRPMASLVETKRGTVYLVENARTWLEPGSLIRLASVASDAPDHRAHDVGLVIFTTCGGSTAAPWGVGLRGAAIPRTIVADHFMLAGPSSVEADAMLGHLWAAPRTAEPKAAAVANAIALRHRRPVVFVDADWSIDRRQLLLTYTTSAVKCSATTMARDINAALRVNAIFRAASESATLDIQL